MELHDIPVWSKFQQLGCTDLIALHEHKYAVPMPNTCQGVTRPDNAIISHQLIPHVGHIRVLSQEWFATHSPVLFSLQLPSQQCSGLTSSCRCRGSPWGWTEMTLKKLMLLKAPPWNYPPHLKPGVRTWNRSLTEVSKTSMRSQDTVQHTSPGPTEDVVNHENLSGHPFTVQ